MIESKRVTVGSGIGLLLVAFGFALFGWNHFLPKPLVPVYCIAGDTIEYRWEKMKGNTNGLVMPGCFYENCLKANGLLTTLSCEEAEGV